MNDQLQQALLAILTKTTNAVGAGVEFLGAQLPEVIRQLLLWKATESGMVFVLMPILAIATWIFAKRLEGKMKGEQYAPKGVAYFGAVMTTIVYVCFFIGMGLDWIQILVAPKIYLIEYVAHLAKH